MTKSSTTQYLICKYGLYILGLILLTVGVLNLVEVEFKEFDTTNVGSIILGLALIILNLAIMDRFRIAHLDEFDLYFPGKQPLKFKWTEVKNINRIPFVTPPIYSVTFKNNDLKIIFNSESSFGYAEIEINGFFKSFDLSEMGSLIEKMKKDHKIQSNIF